MSDPRLPERESLPSGKAIIRTFDKQGVLCREQQSHGVVDIAISYTFNEGGKVEETYLVKKRLVSRKSYEKARVNYPDMPAPDVSMEDWGKDLLSSKRTQQKQRKAETEQRLANSEESRFPRPTSTNWLRVIAGDKAHLVLFASRDWKILSRETSIPDGREWLSVFGFHGTSDGKSAGRSSVAQGPEIGYEVTGDRAAMLDASKRVLSEVIDFERNPPEVSYWHGSVRPRPKPRKKPAIAWPLVLPPLIDFLSQLQEEKVKIFNHHQ